MVEKLRNEDDAIHEILGRALRKEGSDSATLEARLLAAADELGISHDAVLEAQKEFLAESERALQLAEYRSERRRSFFTHLGWYATVNAVLFVINLLTLRDNYEYWVLYPFLGWGVVLAIDAINALSLPAWDSVEFQKWRENHPSKERS